ncbi:hypothetical protein Y032_0040g280 [Ancylostoma ceylanicum]|uniref:Uncharacterized protein n=1 Tax=Ancylostoma ceylanicum TaxID=53326 RepID=A0A016UHF4_9BILA|nr:hypothetical protein Y032_0040g280 [Ancylostoma ceylanicum]
MVPQYVRVFVNGFRTAPRSFSNADDGLSVDQICQSVHFRQSRSPLNPPYSGNLAVLHKVTACLSYCGEGEDDHPLFTLKGQTVVFQRLKG